MTLLSILYTRLCRACNTLFITKRKRQIIFPKILVSSISFVRFLNGYNTSSVILSRKWSSAFLISPFPRFLTLLIGDFNDIYQLLIFAALSQSTLKSLLLQRDHIRKCKWNGVHRRNLSFSPWKSLLYLHSGKRNGCVKLPLRQQTLPSIRRDSQKK